jgi:hypothetical protein
MVIPKVSSMSELIQHALYLADALLFLVALVASVE